MSTPVAGEAGHVWARDAVVPSETVNTHSLPAAVPVAAGCPYNDLNGAAPRREPLLLLFLVAAIGYPIGQLRVAGTNLGVGAVLFAGLGIGALDPSLRLPEIVYLLGLVLFVYTVGLANGASFVAGLVHGRGLRINALVVLVLVISANLTLRQLGLILFLAGIGTRSGYDFVRYLASGGGLAVLVAGAGMTLSAAALTLWAGATLLHLPFGTLAGTLAGLQTQPAVLGFALEQTKDESPNVGYATVYPVAMIAKVLIGQLMLAVVR